MHGISKEAANVVSPEKVPKGKKSKMPEILQGKGTEAVVGGDEELSELGSMSNATAVRQGIEITLNVSVKNHMYLECLCILLNFHDFSSEGSAQWYCSN